MRRESRIKFFFEKGFIWCGVRISFFLITGLWIFFSISYDSIRKESPGMLMTLLSVIWITSTIFNFTTAIIHLTKFHKKNFAIVSLVISSLLLVLFLIGAVFEVFYKMFN